MGRDDRQRTDPFHPGLLRQRDHEDNLLPDISHDGMLQGPAIELYKEIQERKIPLAYLIASGRRQFHTRDIENWLKQVFRHIIFGKAIYEGKIQLEDLIQPPDKARR